MAVLTKTRAQNRKHALEALCELEGQLDERGRSVAQRKVSLLATLDACSLARASHVLRLHEALLFLRAYPDDAAVLEKVNDLLGSFTERADLKRHRDALEDSGIVSTVINFAFYWPMAAWLSAHWPEALRIDWECVDDLAVFDGVFQSLVLYAETPALDTQAAPPEEWFAELAGARETDAQFLVERFRRLPMSERLRETMFDELDVPMRLGPSEHTPSRTHAFYESGPVAFQKRPLSRARPSVRRALKHPPKSVRAVSPREGRAMVDLARCAMLTRGRDLDAISYGNPNDAYFIDMGEGLSCACFGSLPERRLMLESVYLYVILKNGVPVGYFQASSLLGVSELNFNIFDPWRRAESAAIYAKAVSMVHHMFGSDVFAIDPYQLGDQNVEALRTGAFWFYYKLGFRPADAGVRKIVREEVAEIRKGKGHRTSVATLKKMAVDYLYFFVAESRDDVVGKISYGDIALATSHFVSRRFGADREAATEHCAREVAQALGVGSLRDWPENEQLAWHRWSPLVACLDGVSTWSGREKRALVAVIRAKGGRREMDYVRRCLRHSKLRAALVELARREPS